MASSNLPSSFHTLAAGRPSHTSPGVARKSQLVNGDWHPTRRLLFCYHFPTRGEQTSSFDILTRKRNFLFSCRLAISSAVDTVVHSRPHTTTNNNTIICIKKKKKNDYSKQTNAHHTTTEQVSTKLVSAAPHSSGDEKRSFPNFSQQLTLCLRRLCAFHLVAKLLSNSTAARASNAAAKSCSRQQSSVPKHFENRSAAGVCFSLSLSTPSN